MGEIYKSLDYDSIKHNRGYSQSKTRSYLLRIFETTKPKPYSL